MYREVGKLWNNPKLSVIGNNIKFYVLNKKKGDLYYECWETADFKGHGKVDPNKKYIIKPIFEVSGEGHKAIVDYEIREDTGEQENVQEEKIEEV